MTKRKTDTAAASVDWLDQYRLKFLKLLHDQGYAPATVRTYDGAAALLCRVVSRRGLHNGQLVGQALSKVRIAALASMHPNKYDQKQYCLLRTLQLRDRQPGYRSARASALLQTWARPAHP